MVEYFPDLSYEYLCSERFLQEIHIISQNSMWFNNIGYAPQK